MGVLAEGWGAVEADGQKIVLDEGEATGASLELIGLEQPSAHNVDADIPLHSGYAIDVTRGARGTPLPVPLIHFASSQMIYTVNVADIEQALISLGGDAKAKEIQDKILGVHCSGIVPDNYQSERSFRQTIQRKIEDYCPQAEGYDPSKKEGKFLRIGHGIYRIATGHLDLEFPAIEEVSDPDKYIEGATKTIAVNYYERNQKARKKCIDHYGLKCVVCNFDFEKAYGEIGKAFIHVHHVLPLSEVGEAYVVNPINDLRPVCANCHAMIHRVSPALSIEQLSQALNDQM
jgi:5-methylcytosine-specific restriction protein A